MKKYPLLLMLLLCACIHSNSQVLTPDFRYYTSCPTGAGEVNKCTGWMQPTGGSSDYFNACDHPGFVGVPQNHFGYQTCATNAYAGLYTYATFAVPDYKEYIGTDFPALTVGQTYVMTIKVSLADSSTHASDGLGVYFTTYEVNQPMLYTTLLVTPQVDYSSFGVIKDKVNWVTLTKTFVADSAYTHLLVGCFKPYGVMHLDSLATYSAAYNYSSYYYIGQIGLPDSTRHAPTDSVTPPYIDTSRTEPPKVDTPYYAFPNAFTPDWDGVNDIFRILTSSGTVLQDYTFTIFNRWGQRVYVTNIQSEGWDGTLNGRLQPMDVYCYFAEFKVHGERHRLKGNVTLIR